MTIIHRRIIYLIFMAIFFIVLPFIILYSAGYKINSKKNIIQRTGIIFLEIKPKDVSLYLNGKPVERRNPIRLKNLLPNKYEILASKDGYFDWKKKVDVYENQTTFLQYLRLFKKNNEPRLMVGGNIIKVEQSNDNEKLLLYKKNTSNDGYLLSLYNINNEHEVILFDSVGEINTFKFIDNGRKIIVYIENGVWLIDTVRPEARINLADKIVGDFKKLKTDEFNSNFVFYIQKGQLFRLNLVSGESSGLGYYPLDYFIRGDKYYLLTNDSLNNIFLKLVTLSDNKQPKVLLTMAASDKYSIDNINDNFVTIRKGDDLIIFDKKYEKSEIIKGAVFFKWNSKGDELLFGNDWELWSYKPNNKYGQYVLYARTGEDIKKACWYKPETHIFYVVGNKIKVTENLSVNRVTHQIIQTDKIDTVVLNKEGTKLFFIGNKGSDSGLFALDILDD